MKMMNSKRAHMRRLMRLMIANKARIHYLQLRPMASRGMSEAGLRRKLASPEGISLDCSEAVTLICEIAGLRDPNGKHYRGVGNTEMMLEHLNHYRLPRFARVGGLVHFENEDHVCMVMKPGLDPILFSMGGERGPIPIRLSIERQYHPGQVVFLSVAKLL